MAGRPPGGPQGGSSNNRDDLLLDLDNEQPIYNGGQRSTLNDDDLMRFHTQQQEETPSRPSVSYDDFVGGGGTSHPSTSGQRDPSRLDASGPSSGNSPYSNRQYSQTSDLGNYQRYADDFDDFPENDSYYQNGRGMRGDTTGAVRKYALDRYSVWTLGGG